MVLGSSFVDSEDARLNTYQVRSTLVAARSVSRVGAA